MEFALTDFYPNFYIIDGINSSLTISALAVRIAEKIVGLVDYLPVEAVAKTQNRHPNITRLNY